MVTGREVSSCCWTLGLVQRRKLNPRATAEYGGPLFLLPGIVIAMYVTETPIPEEWKIEIAR